MRHFHAHVGSAKDLGAGGPEVSLDRARGRFRLHRWLTAAATALLLPLAAGIQMAPVTAAEALVPSVGNGLTVTAVLTRDPTLRCGRSRDGQAPRAATSNRLRTDDTPCIQLSATSLTFENQPVQTTSPTQNVTVRNAGDDARLKVTNVTVTGADPGQFTAIPAAGCASIPEKRSCDIAVRFAPTSAGAKSATVNIFDNAVGSPHIVALSGTGTAVAPGAPVIRAAIGGNTTATVIWFAPNNGGSPILAYLVRVVNASGTQVGALRPAAGAASSLTVAGLVNGTTYQFQVAAVNDIGTGPFSALSDTVTPAAPIDPGSP